MRNLLNPPTLRAWLLALAFTTLANYVGNAVPYASGITTNGGTVSFILNEAADNVKVIYDGGGAGKTNDLGALAKGSQSFPFDTGIHTSYEIHVNKSAPGTWAQTSDDLNPLVRFYGGRGIAVYNNPADLSRFGRIYIANTAAGSITAAPTASSRTVGKGIYILNSDQSDALGWANTAQTAGIGFASSANSPFKIEMGEDNYLYISDYSDANATIFRTDAEVTTNDMVLSGAGSAANPTVHTDIQGSAIAKGSIAGANLVIWAIDGQWPTGGYNRLLRWDIGNNGGNPLPFNSAPTALRTAGVPGSADVQTDLDIVPDGKFFICQYRATGAGGVYVADRVNIRVLDPDGFTVLWDSLSNSLAIGQSEDIFNGARAIKVSPDQKRMAVIRNDTYTWIVGLTNGVPNVGDRLLLNAFGSTGATSNGREVSWDKAGNLYVANVSHEKMRVWSPGGTTTAITRSGGTFEIVVPPAVVSITATTATANETGPVNGVYTVSRSGDVSAALTVAYTMSGTATSGSDYVALPGSVTFSPGATSTNITLVPFDDSATEFTETAILSLTADPIFTLAASSATVNIRDNETPEITITTLTQPILLEGVAVSRVTNQITRKGLLTALTVNIAYSGTATLASDFSGPPTVALTASDVNKSFTLARVDDGLVEGSETAIASIATGTGYIVGTPGSTSVTVIDDEVVPGTALFSDKFDLSDTAANWVVNYPFEGANASAEFGYDYSVDGLPEGPSSAGTFAAKRGLKMMVNQNNDYQSAMGVSASPVNGNFAGNYRLRFDMWLNYNGPLLAGGRGSSEWVTAGVGTRGSEAIYADGSSTAFAPATYSPDVVWFSVNGDGSSGDTWTGVNDFSAFANGDFLPPSSGVYAAGTDVNSRWSGNAYYSPWLGGIAAPTAQTTAYPTLQTGATGSGNMGFAWHKVAITKQGASVTWDIDGRRIATVDTSAMSLSTNVFVGYNDQYISGSPSNSFLRFLIVDNLKVESLTPPPAPIIVLDTPTNGAGFTASQTINCAATVTDNGNIISKVQFYDGPILLGEDATAPYAYAWTGANPGTHSVKARLLYNLSGTLDSAASSIMIARLVVPVDPIGIAPGDPGTCNLSYTGGSGTRFVLVKSADAAAPMNTWTRVATNNATPGTFSITIGTDPATFYRLLSE